VDLSAFQPLSSLFNVLIQNHGRPEVKTMQTDRICKPLRNQVLYSSILISLTTVLLPNAADDGDPLDGMVLINQPFQGASLQRDRLEC